MTQTLRYVFKLLFLSPMFHEPSWKNEEEKVGEFPWTKTPLQSRWLFLSYRLIKRIAMTSKRVKDERTWRIEQWVYWSFSLCPAMCGQAFLEHEARKVEHGPAIGFHLHHWQNSFSGWREQSWPDGVQGCHDRTAVMKREQSHVKDSRGVFFFQCLYPMRPGLLLSHMVPASPFPPLSRSSWPYFTCFSQGQHLANHSMNSHTQIRHPNPPRPVGVRI